MFIEEKLFKESDTISDTRNSQQLQFNFTTNIHANSKQGQYVKKKTGLIYMTVKKEK